MNLIGEKVNHKSFGEGVITDYTGNYITIKFANEVKKFTYPASFELFLKAMNPQIDVQIKMDVNKAKNHAIEVVETKPIYQIQTQHTNTTRIKSKKRQYFFVFQNKTYDAEMRGGYLWAPKGNVSHWKMMTQVKKGDVIFHSVNKNIVAISIAKSDCYSFKQPKDLKDEKLWEDDGWRVDCDYTTIRYPIITSDHMDIILKLQPSQYAPFNVIGRGNTGYLFSSNVDLSEFLFGKLKQKNSELDKLEVNIF